MSRAAADDSLRLYDVANGALLKTLFAKTYGASKVCFTHAPMCILAASGARASEHDVRYHSFHDNTYLRFFKVRTACNALQRAGQPAALRNPSGQSPLAEPTGFQAARRAAAARHPARPLTARVRPACRGTRAAWFRW